MESKSDINIMDAYTRIGVAIVKELDTMTVGERESLYNALKSMEQTMDCIGMKRLFVKPLESVN